MTFDEMVEIEPMLGNLKVEAEMFSHISVKDKERLWYRDLKKRMSKMVGFSAGKVKKQPPDLTAGEFNRREC
jgi:hypothetical protein